MFSTSTCCPIRWTNYDDILTYISYSCRQPSLPGATDAEELAAGTDGKNPTDSPALSGEEDGSPSNTEAEEIDGDNDNKDSGVDDVDGSTADLQDPQQKNKDKNGEKNKDKNDDSDVNDDHQGENDGQAEPSSTTDKGIYIGSDKDWDNDQASDIAEDAALTDKYDPNSTPQKGDSGT